MKKINLKQWIVILLTLMLFEAIDAQVYTPNGTLVFSNNGSGSFNTDSLEVDAATFFQDHGWTSLVTKIAPATAEYNCHGWVWYMLEGGIGKMRINGYEAVHHHPSHGVAVQTLHRIRVIRDGLNPMEMAPVM